MNSSYSVSSNSMSYISNCRDTVCGVENKMKTKIVNTVDKVLDLELQAYSPSESRYDSFFAYINGLYYLTIAKFTNPIAYALAWALVKKV